MARQLGIPAALAARGVSVETVPGWETRGSAAFDPRGVVCHWTAGPAAGDRPSLAVVTNGRSGLPGPLAQVFLTRAAVAVVVAAGRANHAGSGGWAGLTGNSSVFGIEAESTGRGDWTNAQRVAYPRVVAGLLDLIGAGPEMVCGHSEWAPTRKIDIRDWTMDVMRAQVAALNSNDTADAPREWDEMATKEEIAAVVNEAVNVSTTKILTAIKQGALLFYRSKTGQVIMVNGEGVKTLTPGEWLTYTNLGYTIPADRAAMDPGPFQAIISAHGGIKK